jgi:hypothetical protein
MKLGVGEQLTRDSGSKLAVKRSCIRRWIRLRWNGIQSKEHFEKLQSSNVCLAERMVERQRVGDGKIIEAPPDGQQHASDFGARMLLVKGAFGHLLLVRPSDGN